MPGHSGENLYKIGPNKFMGGGGRGEKGGAFCSVCIFHSQKIHVYLISKLFIFFDSTVIGNLRSERLYKTEVGFFSLSCFWWQKDRPTNKLSLHANGIYIFLSLVLSGTCCLRY